MRPAIAVLFSLCSAREAAARLADRLRGAVRTHQFVRELAMSSASALPNHYPTHAQLFEPHPHRTRKAFCNVIDGDGVAALKRFENNFIDRHAGPSCFAVPYTPP